MSQVASRLANLSLQKKLAAAFGLALMLIGIVGAIGIGQLGALNSFASQITAIWLPEMTSLGEMKREMAELRFQTARRIEATDPVQFADAAARMVAARRALEAAQQAYAGKADAPEEKALFADSQRYFDEYQTSLGRVAQWLDASQTERALDEFNVRTLPAFDAAAAKVEALIDFSRQEGIEAVGQAHRTYVTAFLLTIGVFILAGACFGGVLTWITRSVSDPILRVSDAMRKLAAGDSSVTVEGAIGRGDEIGVLMQAVSGYRESLGRSLALASEAELERERLKVATQNMPFGLSMFDSDKRLVVCNDRFAQMYGLSPELARPGTHIQELIHDSVARGLYVGSDPNKHIEDVLAFVERNERGAFVLELPGDKVFSIVQQPIEDGGWVAIHEDVTERRQMEARMEYMARHDALTGLPNRMFFAERLEELLASLAEADNVAVLCLDIDFFKTVNDTLGHPVGDALLKEVATRLNDCVGEADMVARVGGDEFVIIQADAAQPAGSTRLATRMIDRLAAPYFIDEHQVVVGASVGVAVAPVDGRTADDLLKNGDMALYRAKADGRGTYRFFEPEMDARMQMRRRLELDLRRALPNGEFEVYYQPLIDLAANRITGFEALLRWHHPERGFISPAEFVPLAEEIGLIVPIGEWVLRQACFAATFWPDGIKVAVNLSPTQFRGKRLLAVVATALAASGLPAHRLELEITETVLLTDTEGTLDTLHQLRTLGVRISMDDFGTGYSSLGYLRSFPFDKIKIDRSFVGDVSDAESSIAIVRAVTGLGKTLGIITTAEGVETEEQLDRVRREGCNEGQGYLFSPPVPANAIPDLLAARSWAKVAA